MKHAPSKGLLVPLDLERFRQDCCLSRVAPTTLKSYLATTQRVIACTGRVLGYEAVLRYIATHRHLSSSRLRAVKSAVKFILSATNSPLSAEEDSSLNDVLEGLECKKGAPRKRRGAPSAVQLRSLYNDAMRRGWACEAAAIILGDGIAARPRDLKDLEAWAVDLSAGTVWVERKGWLRKRVREGKYEARPIGSPEAYKVLELIMNKKSSKDEKILPGLDLGKLSQVVREVAERESWDPELLWTGAHNLRHGRARKIAEAAQASLREAGSWKSDVGKRVYAELKRVQPKK